MKIKLIMIMVSVIIALCMVSAEYAAWEDKLDAGINVKAAEKFVQEEESRVDPGTFQQTDVTPMNETVDDTLTNETVDDTGEENGNSMDNPVTESN